MCICQENDFYIISDDVKWENKVLQGLKTVNPEVKCISRKDWQLGKFTITNLIEPVQRCKKVVVGFTSDTVADKLKYVSATAIQRMLDDNTLDQGKLIPVKVTEDAVIPPFLGTLPVFNGWEDDLCHKLLGNLLEQDILLSPAKGLQHHSQEKIESYLLRRQQKLCRSASRFTPATMNTKYKVDISDLFTDLQLLKENEKRTEDPITCEDVLDLIESIPACKVLMDGEGGIGKTTILRHLAFNWSTCQSIRVFEGKIVFLLNVRDLNKGDGILDLIEKQLDIKDFGLRTNLPEDIKLIKTFIINHDDKIVLLIDGLDELILNNRSIINLFKNNEFERSTVILTSRSENIDEFITECNVHVRVNGFNEERIGKYIDKHFKHFRKPELGISLRNELQVDKFYFYREHPEILSLCKNPMLLLSVCIMWEEKQNLPQDKADLFYEIFRCFFNQYNKQQEKYRKISKFENAPTEYVNAMILLGECMYKSLKLNQLSINKKNLKGKTEMVDLALKLGFVYEEASSLKSSFDEIYMPPHKLIVESLVGFYLCKLCEGIGDECAEDVRRLLTPLDSNEWQVIRESDHLKMAREIAICFLGVNADKFLNNWITNNLSTYRSLTSNLRFVKKQHEVAVTDALVSYMTQADLEIKHHIDDISNSLRMFIHHITDVHLDGDTHFIHLIKTLYSTVYSHNNLNTFCSKISVFRNGRVLSHILGIDTKCPLVTLNVTGDVMNEMIRECSDRGISLQLKQLNVHGNDLNNSDGMLLGTLLMVSPELWLLDMCNCSLSGDVINDMITECFNKGVKLAFETLKISDNNLSNIDGILLASLLVMSPKLRSLDMHNCNLSGIATNSIIRSCSNIEVKLSLNCLDISGNDLSQVDGTLLGSLLILPPKLEIVKMSNCNLLGTVMNNTIKECFTRRFKLSLKHLDISGNQLNEIDGTLLGSLLILSPKLSDLYMQNCNLPGVAMNGMVRECCNRKVELSIKTFHINDNKLNKFDGTLLGSLLIIKP
ncbi:uncharacterized protein [Antedon mediterranea]|uniref:uncharacterized protein isoform X2 n=1 Tax=Antedon mediterranea TaxID=105859 RepID=UPI003AF61EF3